LQVFWSAILREVVPGKIPSDSASPGSSNVVLEICPGAGEQNAVSVPKILCIDDEALGLQIRRTVLERAGYQVLTAVDGPTGLSLFRGNEVDGVVLDYYMPEMDGGAVAETMRRERPQVPIMLLSAYINLPAEVVAMVDVTLLKGEGPQELLEKLRLMLGTGAQYSSEAPARGGAV
jgi:CheY-like chemotaxis protein